MAQTRDSRVFWAQTGWGGTAGPGWHQGGLESEGAAWQDGVSGTGPRKEGGPSFGWEAAEATGALSDQTLAVLVAGTAWGLASSEQQYRGTSRGAFLCLVHNVNVINHVYGGL